MSPSDNIAIIWTVDKVVEKIVTLKKKKKNSLIVSDWYISLTKWCKFTDFKIPNKTVRK